MQKYKILHIYNQCVNTTIPLQAFLKLQDESIIKFMLSWNQELDDKNIQNLTQKSFFCKGLGFKKNGLVSVLVEYYKYLRKEKPDLIHVHHSYSAFFGALAGSLMNKKIVLTIHSDYAKYSLLNKVLFWFSMLFSDKIIANSKNTLDSLPKQFNKKSIVIYNGVDITEIINTQYETTHIDNDFVIVTVARLVKLKDIKILIKAFKLLSDKYENVKLYIIGDGVERKNLEELSESLNLTNKIDFKGKLQRGEVYFFLKEADVFCSASKWEGFGNAIVEAMAAKVAIISSEIPVSKEVIGDKNALYFEVGNHEKLFRQLEKLYLNDKLRKELAEKSFLKAQEFSLERNIEEHIKLYKDLLKDIR